MSADTLLEYCQERQNGIQNIKFPLLARTMEKIKHELNMNNAQVNVKI
jgi:alkyl hydroperoxide reductase subunit AhpC